MTTELRDCGDNVVVYTNEQQAAMKLRDRKSLIQPVPYTQFQQRRGTDVLVGWDFYFPRREKRVLLRGLRCVEN